jgi:histidinol-phosphate/aromatic aminotransferase/cobyric acid decarboxylase-like protein
MNLYDYAEKKAISTRQVLDFTALTNPFGPSEKGKHAMRKALKSISLPPDHETRYLRRFIAKKERIPAESILFGQGSTGLLDVLLAASKPGKTLAPSHPSLHYETVIARHGGETVPLPLPGSQDYPFDAEVLGPLLQQTDMVLIPNPHGLTGAVVPVSVLNALADELEGSDKLLVVDEALIEFAPAESPIVRAAQSNNLVILRSFSLFHSLAGLPLGYLVGGPRIIDMIRRVVDPGPVSGIVAAGALASLRDTGFHKRTMDLLTAEKTYYKEKLGKVEGVEVVDTPCSFLLIRFEKAVPDMEERFLQRNILVEHFEDDGGRVVLRVPMRRRRENGRFAKTLIRIVAPRRLPAE